MASEVKTKVGTQFVFADHADEYVGGGATTSLEIAGSTDVQIDVGPLAAGTARNSAKVDLGALRAPLYSVMMTVEPAADPVDGETVDLYWSPSPDSGATVANAGGVTGSDAAFSGYSTLTLAMALKQMMFIGSLVMGVANDADGVQIGYVGVFSAPERYGTLVVVNSSAGIAFHTDAVEFAVSFNEIIDEAQ